MNLMNKKIKLLKKRLIFFFDIYRNNLSKIRLRRNLKKGVLAIDLCNSNGIGAKLVHALELYAICDKNNLVPIIKFTGNFDQSSQNIFDYYFKNKFQSITSCKKIKFSRVPNVSSVLEFSGYLKHVPLEINYSHYLLNKYLEIKFDVQKELDDFTSLNFHGEDVLGIHYRGTDKFTEAPKLNYEVVCKNVLLYIEKYPLTSKIFISSDEEAFINFMKNNKKIKLDILHRDDLFRSKNNDPVHFSKTNIYDINRDAIVNMLLLSKCTTIMKTASILSAVSKLFNPKVKVFLVNKQFDNHRWFPETALIKESILDPIS